MLEEKKINLSKLPQGFLLLCCSNTSNYKENIENTIATVTTFTLAKGILGMPCRSPMSEAY